MPHRRPPVGILVAALLLAAIVAAWTAATASAHPDPTAGGDAPVLGRTDGGDQPLRCVAFSPYVQGYDAAQGPHPPADLIDRLLDAVRGAGFRCIMTYGVLNGLDHTIAAAAQRNMQVIAILWLDQGDPNNDLSIQRGIELALAYPQTITHLSCGSEFRTRHGTAYDSTLRDCSARLRSAGVTQPITSIDTWWEWCNRAWPCQARDLAADVDWIGINVFPWWENKYSGIFPCTTAAQAAAFHLARLQEVRARYPGKEVILTEFGWPAGPAGYAETNTRTGQQCGVAGEAQQQRVVAETLAALDEAGLPGVVFSAFREAWKTGEGAAGPFWGVCQGTTTYACSVPYGRRGRLYVPLLARP